MPHTPYQNNLCSPFKYGVQLLQGYKATTMKVYFLSLGPQEFLVPGIHLIDLRRMKG